MPTNFEKRRPKLSLGSFVVLGGEAEGVGETTVHEDELEREWVDDDDDDDDDEEEVVALTFMIAVVDDEDVEGRIVLVRVALV